jgi:hypothetical protein
MVLQEQIRRAWNNYKKQSKTGGTKIHSSWRDWLWWNIYISNLFGICSHTNCNWLPLEFQAISDGCKECIPKWNSTRRGLLGQPKGFTNNLFPNHMYRLKKPFMI